MVMALWDEIICIYTEQWAQRRHQRYIVRIFYMREAPIDFV